MHRRPFRRLTQLILAAIGLGTLSVAGNAAPTVQVPASINHAPWDALLKKHVNDHGLVDYAGWRNSPDDVKALERYITAFAPKSEVAAEGADEIASLINAYNAMTIRLILENYPTESIRETKDAWKGVRWTIGGKTVSLDEIEHSTLRPLFGWKVHATIVCAARSCPPLQREAFTCLNLEALTAQAYVAWLGRADLNTFDAASRTLRVSPIFKWFSEDFVGDGALARIVEKHGPANMVGLVRAGGFEVEYLDYNWGLNDQGSRGEDYSSGVSGFLKRLF